LTTSTLIFDGDCSFCTTTANYVAKHTKAPLEVVPWQFAELGKFGLTPEQTAKRVYLVDDGALFAGHRAFARILRLQPRWYFRFFGVLMTAPVLTWAFALGYSLVARYRHKLPGGTPACQMPRK
jgi:predicted DCC family thiol-disulfide oxidoreductase YuxK